MAKLTRPELTAYVQEEIKRLEKVVQDYPNHVGTEYLKGKLSAYNDILIKLTKEYEGR